MLGVDCQVGDLPHRRRLKGRYTITGRDVPPADESYTIISAKKLPEGDLWRLEARIQYGQWDLTVPITVPIKWADQTPVISIDKLTIPAMGTFSARVLFNNGMYSGTWAHDEVKGQLFGQVIPATEDGEETEGQDRDWLAASQRSNRLGLPTNGPPSNQGL